MKLKIAFAVALAFVLGGTVSPVAAHAQKQTPSVRQHGSSVHDRSPRIHGHESQAHH